MGYWLQIRTSIPDLLEAIICNFRRLKIVPKNYKRFSYRKQKFKNLDFTRHLAKNYFWDNVFFPPRIHELF